MLRIICLVALFSVSLGQDCSWVTNLDCANYKEEIECGTDGVDYPNRCLFAKARCINTNLHIVGLGTCASLNYMVSSTGATDAPLFEGHNALQDFFCLEMMHENCPAGSQVCGSDGTTYPSFCEFKKQQCSHTSLTMTKNTAC